MFEKLFGLKTSGTNVRTELLAGLTTFFTMAYIMFVNPNILSTTGMDKNAVFVATILATAIATFVMAFFANVPYALAPGMGMNAFFAFVVCGAMKIPWEQALVIVFICGIINIIITVTKIRKMLINAIPLSLQYAISGGIGLFIAYIGFMDGHILDFTPQGEANAAGAFGNVVPSLVNFKDPVSLLTLIGVILIAVLLLLKVKGAIILGIIGTTIIGIPLGVTTLPSQLTLAVPSLGPTFLKLDFAGLFQNPVGLFTVIMLIIAFSLTDTFDTIGTFLGTGRKTGIFDAKDEDSLKIGKGFSSKLDKALFADATATSVGALLGTSNTTTYVESAAGIEAGGKTGLTSATVGILFLICLVLAPIAGIVPAAATAPALIIVGILMIGSLKNIEWDNFEDAVPAFFTVAAMPFTYSIANGVALGFLFYVIAKIFKGKAKEVHPIMYIVTLLFVLKFLVDAIR